MVTKWNKETIKISCVTHMPPMGAEERREYKLNIKCLFYFFGLDGITSGR
jgi:hypothetical protein